MLESSGLWLAAHRKLQAWWGQERSPVLWNGGQGVSSGAHMMPPQVLGSGCGASVFAVWDQSCSDLIYYCYPPIPPFRNGNVYSVPLSCGDVTYFLSLQCLTVKGRLWAFV